MGTAKFPIKPMQGKPKHGLRAVKKKQKKATCSEATFYYGKHSAERKGTLGTAVVLGAFFLFVSFFFFGGGWVGGVVWGGVGCYFRFKEATAGKRGSTVE